MIRPPGFPGVVFGEAIDGDPRSDTDVRHRLSETLGISSEWAIVDQVHGARIAYATRAGHHGEADGIMTTIPSLPIAVATADCVPVVMTGSRSVAVVHAGWRGVAKGIIGRTAEAVEELGDRVGAAVIGPHIGPCCYEIGPEVIEAIGGFDDLTTFGTTSVDLSRAVSAQIPEAEVSSVGICTMHDERFHSHRENATPKRQITVAWIPQA